MVFRPTRKPDEPETYGTFKTVGLPNSRKIKKVSGFRSNARTGWDRTDSVSVNDMDARSTWNVGQT